jgi:hypothetical protein
MRDRHWEEVMRITGGELNLAEDVFKLQHLLDCNILKCREEVEDLTNAAVKEEQIETKLAAVQVREGCVCAGAGAHSLARCLWPRSILPLSSCSP